MKKKSPVLLLIGLVLFALGIFFCLRTYHTSYAKSLEYKSQISELGEQITAKEAELAEASDDTLKTTLEEELTTLRTQKSDLSAEKLTSEKPYSYSLTLLFVGAILAAAGVVVLTKKTEQTKKDNLSKLAQASLLAALCYIGFAFFKIDIPVGTESTAFHLGNVFCVLAALLLGGFWGGLAGAVGMTIGDLTTIYVTSAPKTFLLKFCIGLIVGLVAHQIFKLGKCTDKKKIVGITVLSCVCGMAFNIVADPLVGYLYKTYLLGLPQDLTKALLKIAQLTTTVNAVIAVICATIFYLALRPALKKAGLLTTEN